MAVVVSVTTWELPAVVLTIEAGTVPAGAAVTVTGSTLRGWSWTPRGGEFVSDGGQRVMVDAAAPLNEPLTYQVAWTGGSAQVVSATRAWDGEDAITTLDGRRFAEFWWMLEGEGWDPEPRFAAHAVPGRPRAVLRLDPVAGAGGGTLTAQMWEPHITTMRGFIGANAPVLLFHNEGLCEIPGCEIDPVQVVYLTRVPSRRTEHVDVARREFTLTYLLTDDPQPGTVVPLSTWADVKAAGLKWSDVRALNLTWAQFAATDWRQFGGA